MTERTTPLYSDLGLMLDGRTLLRQQGPGERRRFVLRFATVEAQSETAAKRIQVAWRKKQQSSND